MCQYSGGESLKLLVFNLSCLTLPIIHLDIVMNDF